MSSIFDLASSLEKKVATLGKKLVALEDENKSLRNELEVSRMKRESLEKELEQWKLEYENLKVANAVLGSSEHSAKAKQKINALIRDIDACIVQLSK